MLLIRAFAESGASAIQRRINRQLGIGQGRGRQSRIYRRDQFTVLGGNTRTRGRQRPIAPVSRGR